MKNEEEDLFFCPAIRALWREKLFHAQLAGVAESKKKELNVTGARFRF
jgi:hypothetical protein